MFFKCKRNLAVSLAVSIEWDFIHLYQFRWYHILWNGFTKFF